MQNVMKETEEKLEVLKEEIEHREICRANLVDFSYSDQYYVKNIAVDDGGLRISSLTT